MINKCDQSDLFTKNIILREKICEVLFKMVKHTLHYSNSNLNSMY